MAEQNPVSAAAVYRFQPGSTPLLISVPHAGTAVPAELAARMTGAGRSLPDTDWHVDQLYGFAADIGAARLVALQSRYVIDLNRPVDGGALYPGQVDTGLCPLESFDGEPIYQPGRAPTPTEIQDRVRQYWQPYHQRLQAELRALKARFGYALLWDAHSIRSEVPRLFDGVLPDLNLGTNDGRSCAPGLAAALLEQARHGRDYSVVLDGRFKGGYITRAYGAPARQVHAVQLEISQRTYLDPSRPGRIRHDLLDGLQETLRELTRLAQRYDF